MPAKSPVTDIKKLSLSVTVSVNGAAISDNGGILSIKVTHEINRISYAEIILTGDSVESGSLPLSDGTDFTPGNDIEVTVAYADNTEESIFKGVIVKHGIEIASSSTVQLKVTCKHKAVAMTFNRKEQQYATKLDSDIISSIVSTYGLSATVDATTTTQELIYQKLSTDWDFIMSRAEFYGYIITMDGTSITVGKPKFDGTAVLAITLGESILSFDAELNLEKQPPSLDASAWDIKNQALLKSTAEEPSLNSQGNVTAKTLSGKLSQTKLSLNIATPMEQTELKSWADGMLLKLRMAALKGKVSFLGNASVKTGNLITLAGVGDKFNGDAFVTYVQHVIEKGKWKTVTKFGLDYKPIHERVDFAYPAAVGQLPPVNTLQVATVTKIFEDPQSQYRIMVNIPSNAETSVGLWARMATNYATADAGFVFLPEVGDEVLIGYLENDPRYPVILGSLYSNAKKPPVESSDNNNYTKTIVTKSKLKVTFDDEKKVITIVTPGGNSITISDDAKSIELKDQNSNSIKMSSDGINLESAKDISIKATGNITLNATGKLTMSATQDAALSGMNVNLTAQVGFTGKGNATAEVSASGQTTVKGGIVMIN